MENRNKKENVFKRIKRWWKEELDDDERTWLKVVAIWTVDGAMIGTAITGAVKNNQMKKAVNHSLATGYIQGKLDAYKEIAQNPYTQMDIGMKRLEQQGKAKRF